jgi:hypothetical protein
MECNRLLQIAVLESPCHAVDRSLVQSESACLFVPAGDGRADDAGGALRFRRQANDVLIARAGSNYSLHSVHRFVGHRSSSNINGKFFLFSLVGAIQEGGCPSSFRQRSLDPARKKTLDGAPAQPEASPLH